MNECLKTILNNSIQPWLTESPAIFYGNKDKTEGSSLWCT